MNRSFQHCSAELTKMEPTLRSTQVLKQEAKGIGLQRKDIAEYVTRQQTLDREERAAWREAQKRQVEIRMVELHAEDKKRAKELQAEREKRADEIQMAKIEIEKNSRSRRWNYKLNKLKLKLPPVLQPLHPLVIKMPSPRSYQCFIDEKDELDSYLLRFERYAENAS